jgi:prevent-host-death family protein
MQIGQIEQKELPREGFHSMNTVTAKEGQTRFGQLLDRAQKEDVAITRHDREVAVVISRDRYNEMQTAEDAYWMARAEKAAESGFMSPEATMEYLKEKINAAALDN